MSKTTENLKAAFAGESQARNKYTFFAKAARKEGYHYIAKIFEETAENEKQHAKDHLKLLNGIGDTAANLKEAMGGEGRGRRRNGSGHGFQASRQNRGAPQRKIQKTASDGRGRHRFQTRASDQVEMQHLRLHDRRR